MKRFSWMILALIAANVALFAQTGSGAQALNEEQKQCLRMDEEDNTDALAIPLDEDAYDQCVELDKLEQGKKAQ